MDFDTRILSKKLYGNDSTLRQNLAGQLTFATARVKSRDIDYEGNLLDIPSSEIVLENSIETAKIDKFRRNFEEHIEKEGKERKTPKGEIKQKMLTDDSFDFIENGMDYRELFPKEAETAIKKAYGSHYKVISVKAYRNYPISDSEVNHSQIGGLTQLWHIDSFSPSFLRLFVPLHRVEEEKGPTKYISKKDTKRILSKYSKEDYALGPEHVEEEAEIKDFTVEEGSCYILNVCQHLHKAQVPEPGEYRDLVVFNIVPDVNSEPVFDLDYENIMDYRLGKKQLKAVFTG